MQVSTLGELLAMPDKILHPPSCNPVYLGFWFLKESTLGERLAIPSKVVRPPSSNPAYPVIKVLEAINPGRAISYCRQNRAPTYQLPCVPDDTGS